jgi:DNA repair exonuclease SbcCD ATPase subunit
MRIVNLELTGFRGFAKTVKLDLDANAVLVIAPNGQGKTSLFDSVLWALTGVVSRLGGADDALLSLYSSSGEMHVDLTLRGANGRIYRVSRSSDGKQQRLTFQDGQQQFVAAGATSKLLETIWAPALAMDSPTPAWPQ